MSGGPAVAAPARDSAEALPKGTGELLRIWVKPAHGAPMVERTEVELVVGRGVDGNKLRGGRRARQVSVIDETSWRAAEEELGVSVDPSVRRANLLIRGIPAAPASLQAGREGVLRIGECRLTMHGEVNPCTKMDRAQPGLMRALTPDWRGGSFGSVLTPGVIRAGDPVCWEPDE